MLAEHDVNQGAVAIDRAIQIPAIGLAPRYYAVPVNGQLPGPPLPSASPTQVLGKRRRLAGSKLSIAS